MRYYHLLLIGLCGVLAALLVEGMTNNPIPEQILDQPFVQNDPNLSSSSETVLSEASSSVSKLHSSSASASSSFTFVRPRHIWTSTPPVSARSSSASSFVSSSSSFTSSISNYCSNNDYLKVYRDSGSQLAAYNAHKRFCSN